MNIADKETLDKVLTRANSIGTYISTKTIIYVSGTYKRAMMYYVPVGTKVLCDKTKIDVRQSSGSPKSLDNGYETTVTGYMYVIPSDNNLKNMAYILS